MMETDNFLLKIAFLGGAYHGFQVQKNAPTVCRALQDAMQEVLGARPDVKGCSRTDAGVHAKQYCLSFHSGTHIPPAKLPLALNARLPGDIRVNSAVRVPMGFHARYSACGKCYRYTVLNSAVDDPFTLGQYYRMARPIDVKAMADAAKALCGRHDFAAFKAENGDTKRSTVRTVTGITVRQEGERVFIEIAADGFLYHMARLISGALLEVGLGRLGWQAPMEMLYNRGVPPPALPAKGLCLRQVFYPDTAFVDGI